MTYTCAAIPEKSQLFSKTREIRLTLDALKHVYSNVSNRHVADKTTLKFDCHNCQSYYESKVKEFNAKFKERRF